MTSFLNYITLRLNKKKTIRQQLRRMFENETRTKSKQVARIVTFRDTRKMLRRLDVLDLQVAAVSVDDVDTVEAVELRRLALALTIEMIESLISRPVVTSER